MIFHKKIFYILLFLIIANCSTNKIVKNHGQLSLEKKKDKIFVTKSNKNDVINVLGPPSTKSSFDKNTWIYIERSKISQSIFRLGKKKLSKNNVLVVKLSEKGLVEKKEFYNMNNMNEIEFTKEITTKGYDKNSYMYNLLTSLREKINSPTKMKRQKKTNK